MTETNQKADAGYKKPVRKKKNAGVAAHHAYASTWRVLGDVRPK